MDKWLCVIFESVTIALPVSDELPLFADIGDKNIVGFRFESSEVDFDSLYTEPLEGVEQMAFLTKDIKALITVNKKPCERWVKYAISMHVC